MQNAKGELRLHPAPMSRLAQAVSLLTCIREVHSSTFGRDTAYPEGLHCFSQSLQTTAGTVLKVWSQSLLLQPFQLQFSNHESPTIRRYVVSATEGVVK
jgi:hypothetical protein